MWTRRRIVHRKNALQISECVGKEEELGSTEQMVQVLLRLTDGWVMQI